MKKIILLFALLMSIALFGCETSTTNKNYYKLIVEDNFNVLVHPLNEKYEAGSIVSVYLKSFSTPRVGILVNGKEIYEKNNEGTNSTFVEFVMPNKETTLYTIYNGYIQTNCEGEHTWDEGRLCTIPDKNQQEMVNTCIVCGKEKSIGVSLMETYNLEVIKGEDLLIESLNNKYWENTNIEIKTTVLYDADIEVHVNGKNIKKSHDDSDYWGYAFTMPSKDVVIELIVISGGWIINYDETFVQTDTYGYPLVTSLTHFYTICETYHLLNEDDFYVIDTLDRWKEIYPLLKGCEMSEVALEEANTLFETHILLLLKRVATSSNLIKVEYKYDDIHHTMERNYPYEGCFGEEALYYCLDLITVPKNIFDTK